MIRSTALAARSLSGLSAASSRASLASFSSSASVASSVASAAASVAASVKESVASPVSAAAEALKAKIPSAQAAKPVVFTGSNPSKHRVVVVGSGWGSVAFINKLNSPNFDLTVISPRNYFLFTPLLPSATTGALETRSIVEPIRNIVSKKGGRYFEAEAVEIDHAKKEIICEEREGGVTKSVFSVPFDSLVLSVGSKNNTFGVKGVEQYSLFLKEVPHAIRIRETILENLERASLPSTTPEEKQRLLSFVVVGAGPTGVEYAGELSDFLREDCPTLFPELKPSDFKITVLQAADALLNMYDPSVGRYTEETFKKLGIDAITLANVKEIKEKSVVYEDKTKKVVEVPSGLTIWSAGVDTVDFVKKLLKQTGLESINRRSLTTDFRLRLWQESSLAPLPIFALGDCAAVKVPSLNAQLLFAAADKEGKGSISLREFEAAFDEYKSVPHFVSGAVNLPAIFSQFAQKGQLDSQQFAQAVSKVQGVLRPYPQTAQVANQEGMYLAELFNDLGSSLVPKSPAGAAGRRAINLDSSVYPPFVFRSQGSMAYVGGEKALIDLGNGLVVAGKSTFFIWQCIYLSMQLSLRTSLTITLDWFKKSVFGRDSSRY